MIINDARENMLKSLVFNKQGLITDPGLVNSGLCMASCKLLNLSEPQLYDLLPGNKYSVYGVIRRTGLVNIRKSFFSTEPGPL